MAPLNVGSLCYNYQSVDVIGPFDVLGSGSKELIKIVQFYSPDFTDEIAAKAPDFAFHHIGLTLDPVPLTGGLNVTPTTTIEDCPELDILLLGGPLPHVFQLDEKYAEFIRRHVAAGKLLWTNCTGSFVAAQAGVLDGKTATINNVEVGWVSQKYPKVNWTLDTKWVVDGNIWTAAGAVKGMDMAAHWLKEKYGDDVFRMSTLGLDHEPKNQDGFTETLPPRYDASGKQLPSHLFNYRTSF